jgi:hypothetical protein
MSGERALHIKESVPGVLGTPKKKKLSIGFELSPGFVDILQNPGLFRVHIAGKIVETIQRNRQR